MVARVAELGINLIRQHVNVFLDNDLGDFLQILLGHNRAGGIVRERQYQNLGLVCDGVPQLPGSQAEFILLLQLDDHRHTVGQHTAGLIGYVAGLGNQHLVARIQHGTEGHINAFAAAYGNQPLPERVVAYMNAALQIAHNLLTQLL